MTMTITPTRDIEITARVRAFRMERGPREHRILVEPDCSVRLHGGCLPV